MVLHEAEQGGAERGKEGAEGTGRGEERGSWGGDVGVELRSKYCRIYLNRHRC